jgi:hypothetical protein
MDVIVKLGTERRVLNIMDGPVEAILPVPRPTGPAGSQMGMVICAEEQIKHAIFFGYNAKITAHTENPSLFFCEKREAFCRSAAEKPGPPPDKTGSKCILIFKIYLK